jgi:exodeoxyribonuclease V alpha subunit
VGQADFYFFPADEPEEAVKQIIRLVQQAIPQRFHLDAIEDIQVLTPMQRGELGARNLNLLLQTALNPTGPSVERYGWKFRVGDKVMQTVNNYEKDTFNGDIGRISRIDEVEQEITVRYEDRPVVYDFRELDELQASYAVTVHKSQGSEYPVVVVPIHTQHYMMLQRNLLYTAVTRGKKLVILVGTKKAIAIAVKRMESGKRITTLKQRLTERAASSPKTPSG